MAIKVLQQVGHIESGVPSMIDLKIDNGDFQALKHLQEQWNFLDEPSVLRFALAVLIKAQNKKIYIDQDGKPTAITPGDKLLKPAADIVDK